jgi:tetratricopeptide (TPR) repeat protein
MEFYTEQPPALNKRAGRTRQRYIKRRSGSANAVVQGCLVLFTLCTAGFMFFALILAPVTFRLLPYEDQGRIVRRVSFLTSWMYTETPAPTPLPQPTVDPAKLNAGLALLGDPTVTPPPGVPTAVFGSTPDSPGVAPTLVPPVNPTPAAIAELPTQEPILQNFATPIPIPPRFHMTRYQWEPQTWNNCGPANVRQVLVGYGTSNVSQADIAAWLKPNKNDANVSPWQIVEYINRFTNYRALSRVNGNLNLLKTLMVAKFRPIIETGLYAPKDGSWEGHYVTPIGYNDSLSILYTLDTLLGADKDNQGIKEQYADLNERWSHFNRVYIVIYQKEREAELQSILGADADPTTNIKNALAQANAERKADPYNAYAWFNVGTNYALLKDYRQAAAAFDQARATGRLPWRMNWYQFTLLSAYYHTGEYQTAIDQIEITMANQKNVEELFYWKGLILHAQGYRDLARVELNKAISLNPNFKPARDAVTALMNNQNLPAFDSL